MGQFWVWQMTSQKMEKSAELSKSLKRTVLPLTGRCTFKGNWIAFNHKTFELLCCSRFCFSFQQKKFAWDEITKEFDEYTILASSIVCLTTIVRCCWNWENWHVDLRLRCRDDNCSCFQCFCWSAKNNFDVFVDNDFWTVFLTKDHLVIR